MLDTKRAVIALCTFLAIPIIIPAQETAPGQQTKASPEGLMKDPVKREPMIREFIKRSPEHFPEPVFDKNAPALPVGLKPGGILIFSKTNGFRDDPAIQASNAALSAIAKRHGWSFFQTENAAVMNPNQLSQFELMIWNNHPAV
jgi:hypothetical protein